MTSSTKGWKEDDMKKYLVNIFTLQGSRHPNLIEIYDCFQYPCKLFDSDTPSYSDNKYFYIVMEKCDNDLIDCIGHLTEEEIKDVFKQLLDGLHFLIKTEKVFHRDLKLDNFLIKMLLR